MKRNLFKFFAVSLISAAMVTFFCHFENEEMSYMFVLIICPKMGWLFNLTSYEEKDQNHIFYDQCVY